MTPEQLDRLADLIADKVADRLAGRLAGAQPGQDAKPFTAEQLEAAKRRQLDRARSAIVAAMGVDPRIDLPTLTLEVAAEMGMDIVRASVLCMDAIPERDPVTFVGADGVAWYLWRSPRRAGHVATVFKLRVEDAPAG